MAKLDKSEIEETVKVKTLPKNYVAVHEIVRAIPSPKSGETQFETINPGQRFGATKDELAEFPAASYKDYVAPKKDSESDIEIDEGLEAEIAANKGLVPAGGATTDEV